MHWLETEEVAIQRKLPIEWPLLTPESPEHNFCSVLLPLKIDIDKV